MKAAILKENFKKGLGIVERIAGKNLTLPILNNVLIKTDKNFINLITTNLEIGVKYWILAKIGQEGEIIVPVKILSGFVSTLTEEKIALSTKEKNLFIEDENYKTQIKGLDSQEFPLIPDVNNDNYIEIKAQPLCEAIAQTINFCSLAQTRPEISGIFLNFQKDKLLIVSTDSFRLAEKTLFLEEPIKKEYSFIIPQKTAQEIVNIFSEEDKMKIYFSPNQILFEASLKEVSHPKIQLTSTLIQGDFPNYKDVLPKKCDTKATVSKDDFVKQLKIASLFSSKTNEVKITLNEKKKGIDIFAQNPDIGESSTFIAAQSEGKDFSISFNYKFLIDGISSIKSKNLTMDLNGEDGPAVIKPVGDNTYLYLVMPIKSA